MQGALGDLALDGLERALDRGDQPAAARGAHENLLAPAALQALDRRRSGTTQDQLALPLAAERLGQRVGPQSRLGSLAVAASSCLLGYDAFMRNLPIVMTTLAAILLLSTANTAAAQNEPLKATFDAMGGIPVNISAWGLEQPAFDTTVSAITGRIEELEAGRNPFDEATLESLRNE